jgi:hypothetical protein
MSYIVSATHHLGEIENQIDLFIRQYGVELLSPDSIHLSAAITLFDNEHGFGEPDGEQGDLKRFINAFTVGYGYIEDRGNYSYSLSTPKQLTEQEENAIELLLDKLESITVVNPKSALNDLFNMVKFSLENNQEVNNEALKEYNPIIHKGIMKMKEVIELNYTQWSEDTMNQFIELFAY